MLEIAPTFSAAGLAIAMALAVYLTVADPFVTRFLYRRLEAARDTDPGALTRYYAIVLAAWWGVAALAGTAVLLSPGVRLADLGITSPARPGYAIATCVLLVAAVVWSGRHMRRLAAQDRNIPGIDTFQAMLPRTGAERRLAAAVGVTEGLCANLVYRGLLIALLVDLFALDVPYAAAISVVIYALAGIYQGWARLPVFVVWGGALTLLYVMSGSLLVPVVAGVAAGLRDLLVIPAPPAPAPAPGQRQAA